MGVVDDSNNQIGTSRTVNTSNLAKTEMQKPGDFTGKKTQLGVVNLRGATPESNEAARQGLNALNLEPGNGIQLGPSAQNNETVSINPKDAIPEAAGLTPVADVDAGSPGTEPGVTTATAGTGLVT